MNKTMHPSALVGADGLPLSMPSDYRAGSRSSRDMRCWNPILKSADASMLPEKSATEGRARDLIRNNGFAKGAVQNQKDRIVGSYYRLQLRPRYKLLGVTLQEATNWATEVEQLFHAIADDPENLLDATRKRTFSQILRECCGMDFIHGECLLSREWKENRAGFKTCFQTIEPERLSTPSSAIETSKLRGGVVLDEYGEAVSYWISKNHSNDIGYNGMTTWREYPKFNEYGWQNIFHVFEPDLPNQTRGFSPFASVIPKLKMMDRMEDAELEASILAATYAMVMTSNAGDGIFDSIQGTNGVSDQYETFMDERDGYNKSNPIKVDGQVIPQLFPGDKLEMVNPNHPNNSFEAFEAAMLRHVARGMGLSYEEVSGDYTKTTYSSARAAMQMSWEYVKGRREGVISKIATLIFRAWLDEAIVKKAVPVPKDYWKNRHLWTNCDWIGAGRIIIDEVKNQTATKIALENGTTTLQQACAESGQDWESVIEQRAIEQEKMQQLGLSSQSSTINIDMKNEPI